MWKTRGLATTWVFRAMGWREERCKTHARPSTVTACVLYGSCITSKSHDLDCKVGAALLGGVEEIAEEMNAARVQLLRSLQSY